MTTPLDYQRVVELTPVQQPAGAHLLVWGMSVWVCAAGFAGIALVAAGLGFFGAWREARVLMLVPALFSLVSWNIGRRILKARQGIAARIWVDVVIGRATLFSLVIVGVLGAIFGVVIFLPVPQLHLFWRSVGVVIPVTITLLARWTLRVIQAAEREIKDSEHTIISTER